MGIYNKTINFKLSLRPKLDGRMTEPFSTQTCIAINYLHLNKRLTVTAVEILYLLQESITDAQILST